MQPNENPPVPWTSIIDNRKPVFHLPWRELWNYRHLVGMFVRRDFVANYQQTVLGPLWYFIQPIFTTAVFTVVFGIIARIPTDGLPAPLFFMSGVVIWNYFQSCVTRTSGTFGANSRMFGKVYFPRLAVPVSVVVSNLIYFFIQLLLLAAVFLLYTAQGVSLGISWRIIVLPVLVVQMAMLGLGVGCLVSSLTTKYRDLSMLLGFGLQLWMYASCVVYPLSQVPDQWRLALILINPMVPVIEAFRFSLFGTGIIEVWQLAVSFLISAFVLIFGVIVFSRVEKDCMDVI